MKRLHIDAKADHLLRLARRHDPIGAVAELIWNGLDAEAQLVEVEVDVNDADGVERVQVSDDGHGMPYASCPSYFESLGGSWKATAKVSPDLKRTMNGKNGQGRIRGFALGNHLTWRTVADSIDGRQQTVITARSTSPADIELEGPTPFDGPTGTVFQSSIAAEKADRLNSDRTVPALTAEFAPFLTANPDVRITYRGEPLDPARATLSTDDYSLDQALGDHHGQPVLRVIEWPKDPGRELALCDANGVTLATVPPGIQAPGHHFTAYILWDGFRDQIDHLALADLDSEVSGPIVGAARDSLREHFRRRDEERRRQQVLKWQAEKVYPYEQPPRTPPEAAEREAFDYVATTVARHLPRATKGKRVTLRLLREVVAQDATGLLPVLDDLFRLSKRDREDLTRLLDRTSFANLISASTRVANRLDFIASLRLMVFDPDVNKKVKERRELHRILERETWVFGEEFALLVSDQSLNAVLDRHLQILRKDTKEVKPVRRADGRVGIVDLMLSRARRSGIRREHLVVELKAPKVKITQTETTQLKSYAEAVANDPQFQGSDVAWDFWVVSTEMDDVVRRDAQQPHLEPGQIANWDNNIRVWAKTWGEIVDDCEARLQYYRDCLDHDPSAQHGSDYLNRVHGDLVPAPLRKDPA